MAAARRPPGSRASRPSIQLPEPERLWVRYAPKRWSAGPPEPVRWLDPVRGCLGAVGDEYARPADTQIPPGPFDDVLHVPPVGPGQSEARDRAVETIVADGTPVVVQVLPGDPEPPAGVTVVVDLLDALLVGEVERLDAVPSAAAALWPLIGGLTDAPDLVEDGLGRLAGAGTRAVHAVAPQLPPGDRRVLAEGRDEAVFGALFHAEAPDPRDLARAVARHGLEPFLPRPLPRPPLGGAAQREVGGLLLLAAELCQRLERHGRAQAHFRAARWIDRTRYDPRVLAREGNLEVIHWLDPASREIVEEWAEAGRSGTVDRLVEEYLAD